MDLVADRFEIEGVAAVGGMGTVYRARDRRTGALVALKLLHGTDDEYRARFEREAQILAALAHPAIVRYVAHGSTPEGPFLAMDWIAGETLVARLDRQGLTPRQAVDLARRLAEGLAYAHDHGIIHRDIKPANIMLPGGDVARAVVLDFGVARVGAATQSLTETGAAIGTPSYMAPEQARGERDLDARSDVFALGCVIYESLTGVRAFQGTHVLALVAKIALWEPRSPRALRPEIPAALDELVRAMFAKDPAARPRDGRAVLDRLDALAPIDDGAAAPTTSSANDATVVTPRAARAFSVVIAQAAVDAVSGNGARLAEPALRDRRARVAGALAGTGVTAEVLEDGTVVAIARDPATSPRALVATAIAAASALRRALPELAIAVASAHHDEGHGDRVVDAAVAALDKEAIATVFAGVAAPERPAAAIRIDATTRGLIGDQTVIQVGGALYVAG